MWIYICVARVSVGEIKRNRVTMWVARGQQSFLQACLLLLLYPLRLLSISKALIIEALKDSVVSYYGLCQIADDGRRPTPKDGMIWNSATNGVYMKRGNIQRRRAWKPHIISSNKHTVLAITRTVNGSLIHNIYKCSHRHIYGRRPVRADDRMTGKRKIDT